MANTAPNTDAKFVAEARSHEIAKLGVYSRAWTRVNARLLRVCGHMALDMLCQEMHEVWLLGDATLE